MSERVGVIVSFPLPVPNLSRLIWQPVTDRKPGKAGGGPNNSEALMRLAPLGQQPSGAHHALEFLAAELTALRVEVERLKALVNVSTDYGKGVHAAYLEGFEDGWDEKQRGIRDFADAQSIGWEDSWMFRSLRAVYAAQDDVALREPQP